MKYKLSSSAVTLYAVVFLNFLLFASCYHRKARANGVLSSESSGMSMESNFGANVIPDELKDAVHGVKMGVSSDNCDNAMDNLAIDWDGSPENYTCFHPKSPFSITKSKPIQECDIPKNFYPKHKCMNEKLEYDTPIPTYGHHRPLWPVFGEYVFVPVQRWLHNLEHGAVVMLYHPCAEPLEVERLKILVRGCIRKHIVTPNRSLPMERPLALITWGCKLLMNHVDKHAVTKFIREHALHAPEGKLAKQGTYRYKLRQKALTVPGSDYKDSNLCPRF